MGGMALGGIVLGVIGSIAGLSLGVGTMVARDMLEPILKVRTEAGKLMLMRMSVVGAIVVVMAIALANQGSQILFWNNVFVMVCDVGANKRNQCGSA